MEIKYNEYLELVRKFFIKDLMFDGKVLVARTPNENVDNYLDFSFYLTRGIDFTDYCLLDPILAKRNYFNKSQINKAVNTEENRNNGVCGYVIFQPNKFTDYAGQVQSYSPMEYEKFIDIKLQNDVICGRTLENIINIKKKDSVINSWIFSYKLCYNITKQEDIDLVHSYNDNFNIKIGDKIPPVNNIYDSYINIDIIDLSVLIEKLEKAKDDFIKVYPKSYSHE